ncbi:MAG: sulfatase-like hydrolase/transferase [Verrucomicrobiota bacterium]
MKPFSRIVPNFRSPHHRRQVVGILVQALSLLVGFHALGEKPNILLIMADDLGAENLACYGNTVHLTPHLDRMAEEGALFDHAYATPVCTPTRAMILTGLYPNRTGFLERLDSPRDAAGTNRLPVHLKTVGHIFQESGYATAIAGKWHLGDFQKHPDQPGSHGFEEHSLWVQYWDGKRPSRYFAPHHWEQGELRIHGKDVFGPDHHAQFLMDFMDRNRERPFLAYFPMNLIHGPLVIPPGDFAQAKAKFPSDLDRKEQINALMVHHMDRIVGRLLAKLEELGLTDRTLVLFTGDNGTSGSLTNRLGEFHLSGGKRTMNEAGTRVPFLAYWPGKVPPGKRDALFTLMDVLPTLASLADIPLSPAVDGLDLSHQLFGTEGVDREHVFMAFEGDCYFVRDRHHRLHEDGRFYHVPVTSNETRYHMETSRTGGESAVAKANLQRHLDALMRIRQTDDSYRVIPFGTFGDRFKNEQQKRAQQPPTPRNEPPL